MGRGMGRGAGGGRGTGRGMGRGWARGMGGRGGTGREVELPFAFPSGIPQQPPAQNGGQAELSVLRTQAQALEEQLRAIKTRLAELGEVSKSAATVAVVDIEKCRGCGICENICPKGAITVDEVARVDSAKCDGCGRCVSECPQEALSLRGV